MMNKQKNSSPIKSNWQPRITNLPRFHIIALVLVLVGMTTGGYLVLSSFASEQDTYNVKADPALQVQNLTKVSRSRAKRYRAARQTQPSTNIKEKSELIAVVKERKKAMLALMASRPQEARKYAADDELKSNIPEEVKSDVENLTKLDGTWSSAVVDSADHKSPSSVSYRLVQSNGTQTVMAGVEKPEKVKDGNRVQASGLMLDHVLATSSNEIQVAALTTNGSLADVAISSGTAYIPPALGTKKVAVYLVNYKNDKSMPQLADSNGTKLNADINFVKKYLTTNTDSIAKFYNEQSYGKMGFEFTVYDWKTVNYDNTTGCYSIQQPGPENDALSQNGNTAGSVNYKSYDIHMFLFNNLTQPPPSTCNTEVAGTGAYPINDPNFRPRTELFLNKIQTTQWFWSSVAHELGHNLGLAHAMSKFGDDKQSALAEYGDPYSVMGRGVNGESVQFNAFHKYQLGWLNDSQIATASGWASPTPIALEALSIKPSGQVIQKKAIKVINGNDWPVRADVYIEYRSIISSTDKFIKYYASKGNLSAGIAMPGVIVYGAILLNGRHTSMLVDPLTEFNNAYDAPRIPSKLALLSGEQTLRRLTPIQWTAKVTSTSTNSALVNLQMANDTKAPLAPMNVGAHSGNRSVDLSWQNSTDPVNFDLRSIRIRLKGLKDYSGNECYIVSNFDYGRVPDNILIDGTSGRLAFYTNNTRYQFQTNPSNCAPENAYVAGVAPFVNGQPYTITLQSEDLFGNKSPEVSVTVTPRADITFSKPVFDDGQKYTLPPNNLRVIPRVNVSTAGVQLTWDASPSPGVMTYKIYRNGALAGTTIGNLTTSHLDYSAKLGGQAYTVRAIDNNGIESADSNAVYASCGWLFLWTCK